MKTLVVAFIILSSLSLAARTFTSADGERTMEAKLFSYNPSNDTIVIQIDGQNNRSTVKASLFSEKDQEHFKEFLRESEKFSALRVESKSESERFEEKRGLYIYNKRKEHFTVTVENSAEFGFEGLEAKYDIYFYKYGKDGEKTLESLSGESNVGSLGSKDSTEFNTEEVQINIDCASTSSCPKCVKQASSVERERVVGVRIRIYNSEDELLSEYHSSNSTRAIADKKDAAS